MSLNQDTELKAHSKRVMGISYEAEYEHIISISEDGKLKCSELTSEDPVFELTLGKSGLKCLIHDKDHKRLFVGAGDGSVYIVSHVNYPPELIATIKTLNESCIRGMCIDNDKKFLFTGDTNGFINCFDLGPVGKERFAKQVTEMSGMSKIRFLVWANENREIFAGNQNGKVTIWDTLKGQSVFVHEAHENAITKMQFFDKSRYLMTSSKEKLFNIWEMPREWIKEELPDAIPDDEEAKFKSKKLKQMLEPKEEIKETEDFNREEVKFSGFEPTDAFKNMEDGFDPLGGSKFKASNINRNDDDLMGWHK